ncbi:MAG: hypothetical protein ABJA35_14425 [Parafilimonas sp.]
MPYKNDNLEELFKNAAEDYPLKTNNSDWDSVASKLNITASKTTGKNYRFLAYTIFALLLLGGSLIIYKTKFESQSLSNKQLGKEKIADNTEEIQKLKSIIANNPVSVSSSFNNKIAEKAVYIHLKKNHVLSHSIVNNLSDLKNNIEYENPNQQNLPDKIISNKEVSNSSFNTDEKSIKIENANKSLPFLTNNSLVTNNSLRVNKQVVKIRSNTSSRFYGSLYGGPEFSMVKFQHLTNSGYQIGVALGYRVSNRFDVEVGLQREHISYYTNGEYFEKSGLKLHDQVALENVNGNNKITSVPVTLKYNFSSHKYGHFFATAGIDAIMLTHTESYDYVTSKNGNENDRSKNYSSVTAPKYFTAINASAGYETKLSNWCNMKIEPYYQLPISNIGVGKVPVTSFGINIGIVKDLK